MWLLLEQRTLCPWTGLQFASHALDHIRSRRLQFRLRLARRFFRSLPAMAALAVVFLWGGVASAALICASAVNAGTEQIPEGEIVYQYVESSSCGTGGGTGRADRGSG